MEIKVATEIIENIKEEVKKMLVGQHQVLDEVIWAMMANGHVLLEGLPGVGKTMLIKTISKSLDAPFSRIQFTPDMMPADITGTKLLQVDENNRQSFEFEAGPVFSNIILADEINRATPKTQSALLEAMGERSVTVMGTTYRLNEPFFVLATQNPIDQEGTYSLPEAQLDRFICKVYVDYPTKEELKEILRRTTENVTIDITKVASIEDLLSIQKRTKDIIISESMLDFATNIILATQPTSNIAPEITKSYCLYGSGPRGLQSLVLMAKARALTQNRLHVSIADIKQVATCVLRHRIMLNFEAQTSGITVERLIEEILESLSKS